MRHSPVSYLTTAIDADGYILIVLEKFTNMYGLYIKIYDTLL